MRLKNVLRNSINSVISQILILILSFITRKVFILFLNIEYLGYESLFSNIFTILSVTELGIGGIITFHLYKEIAEQNVEEIIKLMNIYKWFYRAVAVMVLVLGGITFFFLPYIIHDNIGDWNLVRIVYFLQLLGIVFGYFLSYRRTIFIAHQREYICVQIDMFMKVLVLMQQIFALAALKSFIAYLIVKIVGNIATNVVIAIKSDKKYPYLKDKCVVTWKDVKRRNMVSDAKNFLVHQFAYAVYGGTDNIIISAFCGLRAVAIYGNYYLVASQVKNILLNRLLDPIQATLGNLVYSNEPIEKHQKYFKILDLFSFFFAVYISSGFLIFFQPFIILFFGKNYLLPFSFVVLYAFTSYLGAVFEIVYKYRCAFGDFKQDRNFMVLSAVVNLVLSIIFVKKWGIAGVQFGTLVAMLPTVYGRIRFVLRGYLKISVWKYCYKHVLLLILAIGENAVLYFFTYDIEVSIAGFVLRIMLWIIIPLIINIIVFFRTTEFFELVKYLKKIIVIVKNRFINLNTLSMYKK